MLTQEYETQEHETGTAERFGNGRVPMNGFGVVFAVSGICHLLLFIAVVCISNFSAPASALTPAGVIDVSVVSFPDTAEPVSGPVLEPEPVPPAAAQPEPETEEDPSHYVSPVPEEMESQPEPVREEPEPEPEPIEKKIEKIPEEPFITPEAEKLEKKEVPEKPKEKPKEKPEPIKEATAPPKHKAPNKRVVKSKDNAVKKAIDNAKQRDQSIQNAIARIETKVTSEGGTGNGSGTPFFGAQKTKEIIDTYANGVGFLVERQWALPEQLIGDTTDLETLLLLRIAPNGEITDIEYEKKSGNRHMDESAFKAAIKANPVPPHPHGIFKPYIEMIIRFTPSGIQ